MLVYQPATAGSAIQSIVTIAARHADARSDAGKEVAKEWGAEEDPFQCTALFDALYRRQSSALPDSWLKAAQK